MRTLIYTLMVVLLGLRVLELHAGLAPVPHTITQIALIIGMYSLLFAWICVERSSTGLAMKAQPAPKQQQTKSTH